MLGKHCGNEEFAADALFSKRGDSLMEKKGELRTEDPFETGARRSRWTNQGRTHAIFVGLPLKQSTISQKGIKKLSLSG